MRTEQAYVLLVWDAEAIYIFKKVVVISKTIPVSLHAKPCSLSGLTAGVEGCSQQLLGSELSLWELSTQTCCSLGTHMPLL